MWQGTAEVSFTEFIMLSMFLGADKVVGIPDPDGVSHMDEEKFRDFWMRISPGLRERGLILNDISAQNGSLRENSPKIERRIREVLEKYVDCKTIVQIRASEEKDGAADVSQELLFLSENGIGGCSVLQEGVILMTPQNGANLTSRILQKYQDLHPLGTPRGLGKKSSAVLSKDRCGELDMMIIMGDISGAKSLLIHCGMDAETAADAVLGYSRRNNYILISSSSSSSSSSSNVSGEFAEPHSLMFFFGNSDYYVLDAKPGEAAVLEALRGEGILKRTGELILRAAAECAAVISDYKILMDLKTLSAE